MKIPNADYLERTGARISARGSGGCRPRARTRCTSYIRSGGFYFVLEGTGRLRVGDETLTVPKYGGVLVGPERCVKYSTTRMTSFLWLIVGGPGGKWSFFPGQTTKPDMSLIYPVDPKQLPKELAGVEWSPGGQMSAKPNAESSSDCRREEASRSFRWCSNCGWWPARRGSFSILPG